MKWLFVLLCIIVVTGFALAAIRYLDWRADRNAWALLAGSGWDNPPVFDPAMLEGLPEPAQRFFRFAIEPGAPLATVVIIGMGGELGMGNRDEPGYRMMQARQLLAPPHGFVWQVVLPGGVSVSGSDVMAEGKSWSRFRLMNFIPVARGGGNPDHLLSSFGRMLGEALFWTPAAFLPQAQARWNHLEWQAVDENTASVLVRHNGLEQAAEITVDEAGRPLRVVFQRWSNENPEKAFRRQPFGGDLSVFERFGGFTLPTEVSGGNHYGTDAYFPFFKAQVRDIRFPQLGD